jgi:cytoskeletal protein CcmA (bactofilin family)
VTVPHIIVNGRIDGNVRATERIELQNKGEITGDVSYKVIEIAAGAAINGALTREAGKGAVVTRLKQAEANTAKRDAD